MKRSIRAWLMTAAFSAFALVCVAAQASASPLQEIPEALAGALETSEAVAGLILSSGILMSAAITLAVTKTNMMGTLTVLMVVLIALVAIEWLPYWALILVGMFAAANFSTWFANWYSGHKK